jgi:hypothetical protein
MLHYRDIGDYLTREQKLAIVDGSGIADVDWKVIVPNEHGDWINQRRDDFLAFNALTDMFKLRSGGVKSNRDGIGTRIKITSASGLVQYNHVTTAGSYASSNDPRVHFGLGSDAVIKEMELRWPSGTVQILHHVKADQILTVGEE